MLELKKKIGCKSFKWFMENVHSIPVPDEINDYKFDDAVKNKTL
jgi:hypothetical protein